MTQNTNQNAIDLALQHHQAGRLQQAEQLYRQVLATQPDHVVALQYLGVLAYQTGNNDVALDLIRRAVALNPNHADAYVNLGNALRTSGRLDEAIAAHRQAISLRPNFALAHYNLGNAMKDRGRFDEAVAAFRHAIALESKLPEAHFNLGSVLKEQGHLDDAITAFERAISLRPGYPDAFYYLGNTLRERGRLDDAIAAYRQAIALRPDHAATYTNLGTALAERGSLVESMAAYRQAIALDEGHAMAYSNISVLLGLLGLLDEAYVASRKAIALAPDYPQAHHNLGNVLRESGRLDEAIAAYRQAIALRPDYADAHGNLVYSLQFHPDCDALAIAAEHRDWNQRHPEPPQSRIRPHLNDRNPDRRLRIGYVSPDFREHPVGRFILPILENHDHQSFEIIAYINSPEHIADEMTRRLRSHVDIWRSIVGLTDEQAEDLIRQDGIDILVDLTLQMANNRMAIFARKPAPVQVTYLAYAGSSGLSTIDYRLSDPYLDPSGGDDSIYSEKTVRLPDTYWCYPPGADLPVLTPPMVKNGFVTFGCLNSFAKVNEPLLGLWAQMLAAVPESRLILHSLEGSHRQRVLDFLQGQGIEPSRIKFAGKMPTLEYFKMYQSIDVALDTFPYGGGTTTCDALWMGVPVVSFVGRTAVGRGGSSILSNIGLPELLAHTRDQYVRIAVALAQDAPRLKELRSTLRQRMQASPLMDAPRFAANVEDAYRRMWRAWCGN